MEEPKAGEICFIESAELRPVFKTYFTLVNVLVYTFALLHSSSYNEKDKEILNVDFTKVPCPENSSKFWSSVKLGNELRSSL